MLPKTLVKRLRAPLDLPALLTLTMLAFSTDYVYSQSIKGYHPAISKSCPPPRHFLKFPIPPPYRQIGHPKFSLLTEMQLKLNSINTIHVKQQTNVGFLIFKFTLKYMLGNVYINKIHARQCLYIISLCCREGFSHSFNFFVVSIGILHV